MSPIKNFLRKTFWWFVIPTDEERNTWAQFEEYRKLVKCLANNEEYKKLLLMRKEVVDEIILSEEQIVKGLNITFNIKRLSEAKIRLDFITKKINNTIQNEKT